MDTVKNLACKRKEKILYILFEHYQINCMNMHRLDSEKLDELIASLDQKGADREKIISQMIRLFASVSDTTVTRLPVIERVKDILLRPDIMILCWMLHAGWKRNYSAASSSILKRRASSSSAILTSNLS